MLSSKTHLDLRVRLETEPLGNRSVPRVSSAPLSELETHRFCLEALARMTFVRNVLLEGISRKLALVSLSLAYGAVGPGRTESGDGGGGAKGGMANGRGVVPREANSLCLSPFPDYAGPYVRPPLSVPRVLQSSTSS